MRPTMLLALLLLAAPTAVAQTATDPERARAELLALHRADREAHFAADADRLLERSPDEMIMVSDGAVRRAPRAEMREMMRGYFRDARYQEWDDLEPPIVRVSRDGTMGWIITRLRVRRTQPDSTGVERERRFVYAGITTYEKAGGRWLRVANVSTFEPAE